MNWNLAPVADVNNEPLNPIIGNRSYGSDPQRVASLVDAAVRAYAVGDDALLREALPRSRRGHRGLARRPSDHRRRSRPARPRRASAVPRRRSRPECRRSCSRTSSCRRSIRRRDLPASLSRRVVTDLLRERARFRRASSSPTISRWARSRRSARPPRACARSQAGRRLRAVPLRRDRAARRPSADPRCGRGTARSRRSTRR